ncbi:hypothetical protein C6Y11_07830 [Lactiplantibacillus pentosus]|jgi:hypothetical protein|uniref:Uncharacterized protein n=1 Tax=Lactiplantibacillus pentosus TaxID=1589 RepID=A0ABD7ITG2_LACPE|nr:hypothetical protein CFK27_14460 [Lactiplantibacillus pentosus]BBM21520.1 uncharacterized protein SN13T_1555 [Lactiplantibacillus plantarum]AYG41716.1 hypothetical protein CFI14_11615 [Lactiplantibacillus pentosus]MCS8602120.1 hypothetical protein [Lactiplantibacillus pentosus]MCT3284161.1 hypothetical protein [Lactiplantibacillus pentosus]
MFAFLAPQNKMHKWIGIIGLLVAIVGPWFIYWNTSLGSGLAITGFLTLTAYLEFIPTLNRRFINRLVQVLMIIILAILFMAYVLVVFIIMRK